VRSSFLFALSLSACIFILACLQKAPAPPEPEPAPQPIALGELGSHPLIFKSVSFRIPTGTVLGEVRVGSRVVDELRWTIAKGKALDFNVSVTDGLRDLGYNVRDSADALFDPAGDVKIRFVMAAILHSVEVDFEYEDLGRQRRRTVQNGVGFADVEVEVQLHDAVANKTVYKRTFQGHGEDEGVQPNPIIGAVVGAILKTATDAEFVGIISKGNGQAEAADPSVTEIEIGACQRDESSKLPLDLPQALKSVVELQVGGAQGTGVIVSPEGWIMTAAHVVDGAPEIWVRFANGMELPATLAKTNTQFDVALIRVQGRAYPCSPIRNASMDLAIGSDVFAINLSVGDKAKPTVARGVISGYPELEGRRFIQTDASINPGSSGGPVFAADGTIAGITVAKALGIGIEGLGFAVPIRDVVGHLSVRFGDD
jgi:S1-C subfamily serine protease